MNNGTIKLGLSLGEDFVEEIRRDFSWYKPFIIQIVLETGFVKADDMGTLYIRKVWDDDFAEVPTLFFRPDGKYTIDTAWGLNELHGN